MSMFVFQPDKRLQLPNFSSGGIGNSTPTTNNDTKTITSQSTINTVDNRAVQGNGATIGGNVTVNSGEASQVDIHTTDLGAIKGGLDLAFESLQGIQSAAKNATDSNASIASDSISQAYGLANEARQSETSAALNNFLKYGAIIAGLAIIAWAVARAKR